MFKYRLVTTFIAIPIIIFILFLAKFSEFMIFNILLCLFSFWEWCSLSGFYSNKICIIITIIFSLVLSILILYISLNDILCSVFINTNFLLWIPFLWWIIAFILILNYPSSNILLNKSVILKLILGIIIIISFLWGICTLRFYNYHNNCYTGSWLLLYIISIVWSADSGAYVFGKIFGKHKLAPKLSPNKTWEGLIGGLLIAISLIYLFNKYLILIDLHAYSIVIPSVVAVIFSVIGDLTESMFKREAGIKDSSNLIFGHGGILDCIDSLMAAIPIFSFLILD